jgi:putative ABC transport system permease protein
MLDSKIGDTIILFGSNRYGGLSVVPAKVESTSKSFRNIRQGKGIMLPIKLARMLLGWGEEEVRLVQVNFDDFWKADEYTKELRAVFPDLKITSWRERLTNIEDLFKVSDFKMNIFAGIILILVAGIIMNTILTSVLERKNDIGTLRSIGASRVFVTKMILLEIIFVSIIGTLIGTGLSYVIVGVLLKGGIVMGEVGEVVDYMSGAIVPKIVPLKWFIHITFAVIWAIIWSLYPIVYIIRMKPVDALRKTL